MKPHENSLLVVDDDHQIRTLIGVIAETEGYDVVQAESGEDAVLALKSKSFDLLISDINMTGMTGVELLEFSRDKYADMAVIMVTGVDDRETAIETLHMGAYGYVTKPFQANELIINITNALRRRTLEIENRRHRENLEFRVEERTRELNKSREESIQILSKAAEFRDDETAKHTIRMGHYCEVLGRVRGLRASLCNTLREAAPLHDVGKIGISDAILRKPGKLTKEEYEIIKTHCEIGHRILAESTSEVFQVGAEIALTHHEKYDGTGYPHGLKSTDIPITGRIAAVCDVFDALTSKRVYKPTMPIDKAVEILKDGRGSHFDPDVLDAFLANFDTILEIRDSLAD